MKVIEIKLKREDVKGMALYEANFEGSTEVFSYEIAKYFDWLDNWTVCGDELTIYYSGAKPSLRDLKRRVSELAQWHNGPQKH